MESLLMAKPQNPVAHIFDFIAEQYKDQLTSAKHKAAVSADPAPIQETIEDLSSDEESDDEDEGDDEITDFAVPGYRRGLYTLENILFILVRLREEKSPPPTGHF